MRMYLPYRTTGVLHPVSLETIVAAVRSAAIGWTESGRKKLIGRGYPSGRIKQIIPPE